MDFIKRALVVADPAFFLRRPRNNNNNNNATTSSSSVSPPDGDTVVPTNAVTIDLAKDCRSRTETQSSVDGDTTTTTTTTTTTDGSLAKEEQATESFAASAPPPPSTFDSAATADSNPTINLQARQKEDRVKTKENTIDLTRERRGKALPKASSGAEDTQPRRAQFRGETATGAGGSLVVNKGTEISVSAPPSKSNGVSTARNNQPSSSSSTLQFQKQRPNPATNTAVQSSICKPSTISPLELNATTIVNLPPLPTEPSLRQDSGDYTQTLRHWVMNNLPSEYSKDTADASSDVAPFSTVELPRHTSIQVLEKAETQGTVSVNAAKAMQDTSTDNPSVRNSFASKPAAAKAKPDDNELLSDEKCSTQSTLNAELLLGHSGETPQGANNAATNQAKQRNALSRNQASSTQNTLPSETTNRPTEPQSTIQSPTSIHATTFVAKRQVQHNALSTDFHVAFQARYIQETHNRTDVIRQGTNQPPASISSIATTKARSTGNTQPILFYKCPVATCQKLFAFLKNPNPPSTEINGAPRQSSHSNTSIGHARNRVLGHLRNEHPTVPKETLLAMLFTTYPISAFTLFTCPVDGCESEVFCGNSLGGMHSFASKYGPDPFAWPMSPFDSTFSLVREHMNDYHPNFPKENWKIGFTAFLQWQQDLTRTEDLVRPSDSDVKALQLSESQSSRNRKRANSEVETRETALGASLAQNPEKRSFMPESNVQSDKQKQISSPIQGEARPAQLMNTNGQEHEYFKGVCRLFGFSPPEDS